MPRVLLTLPLLLLVLAVLWPTLLRAEEPGADQFGPPGATQLEWLGDPPGERDGQRLGAGAFRWGGGSWHSLVKRLEEEGCRAQALWLPQRRLGWHGRAPAFVNRSFVAAYGHGAIIPPGPLAVVCASEANTQPGPPAPEIALGETQVRWLSWPEHNPARNKQGTATVQYGGGSMYHLVSRLSTQGCNAHQLEIVDPEDGATLRFNYQHTNEQNQAFADRYRERIPPGTTVGVACVDNCDVIYGLDLVADPQEKRRILNTERCLSLEKTPKDEIISVSECADDWSEKALLFFTRTPVFQNVCKFDIVVSRYERSGSASAAVYIDSRSLYQLYVPTISLFQHKDTSQRQTELHLLSTELHELCHIQQNWYTFKEYIDYNYLRDNVGIDQKRWAVELWYETPMAQEFNDIVGFSQGHDGTWKLRNDNPYRGIYGDEGYYQYFATDPSELSADLCSYYLLQQIQPNSTYERHAKPPYITQELAAWMEKYIVLPEPEGDSGPSGVIGRDSQ